MSIKVTVDTKSIMPKIKAASKGALHIVTQQVLKDSNLYIPADTWNMRDSSLRHSDFENGKVVWSTPYARKMYYGAGFNYSRDKNPLAQSMWHHVAATQHEWEWIKVAQKAVEKLL